MYLKFLVCVFVFAKCEELVLAIIVQYINTKQFVKMFQLLPTIEGGDQMLPEGMFWLLITGEVPTAEQVNLSES